MGLSKMFCFEVSEIISGSLISYLFFKVKLFTSF